LYLICAKLAGLQSRTHAVNQSGYEMKDLFFSGMATSEAVFEESLRQGISVICDVGSDITEVLMFKDGVLSDIELLFLGGNDLTVALEDTLEIPSDFAEEIKKSYGVVGENIQINEDKEILIKKDNLYKPIKQREVAQIITAKAGQLCKAIKDAIEKHVASTKISNVSVCGRTMLQEGLLEMLEKTLGARTQLARISNPQLLNAINKHEDLAGQKYSAYITALGIVNLVLREYKPLFSFKDSSSPNPVLRTFHRVRDIYQEYF